MEHAMQTLFSPHTATALASLNDVQCMTSGLLTLVWFAFIMFTLLSIVCYALTDMCSRKQQMFWYGMSFVSAVSALAYMSIAHGIGHVITVDGDSARCFYAARYIDVAVTLPVQLMLMQLFACANAADIAYNAALTLVVVATTATGSFARGNDVWLYLILAITFQLPVIRLLVSYIVSGGSALAQTTMTQTVTGRVSMLATTLLIYILAFDLGYFMSVCTHSINDTTQLMWSVVLDAIVKSAFAMILLSNRDALDAVADVMTTHYTVEGEHSTRSRTSSYHSLEPADRPLKSTITPMRE